MSRPASRNGRVAAGLKPLLVAILAILTVAGLRAARPVLLPFAAALFLVALVWPVQRRLERRIPAGLAVLVSVLILLAGGVAFVGALGWAAKPLIEQSPEYLSSPSAAVAELEKWARNSQLPVAGSGEPSTPDEGGEAASDSKETPSGGGSEPSFGGSDLVSLLTGIVLAIAFCALALLEVRRQKNLLREAGGNRFRHWHHVASRIGQGFRRYLAVRTGVGLVTGVTTGLFAWAVGLELALVWGALNFLLNYIPTIGSFLAVVPPTLFALAEHGSGMAALVLAGIGGVQLVMGNWIDPLAQGRALRLSPLVVLLAVTFWGWVWGVAGAFLGVPITLAGVIALDEFDRTRWLAAALGGAEST